jgi:hypothetical protein
MSCTNTIIATSISTGKTVEFSEADWYAEKNSGEYLYHSVHRNCDDNTAPTAKKTVKAVAKKGCGCGGKRK